MGYSKHINREYRFRILTADERIKFAGTDHPSWLTLDQARKLVDYDKGEMIYEFNNDGRRLWQIF